VAEYLGHADLSTVARYAHVASEELRAAAQALAEGPMVARSPSLAQAANGASTHHAPADPE
jgi:hypothetical protein